MKRYLAGLVSAAVLVASLAAPAFAARPENKFQVTFNGHPVMFDVNPEIQNDRTFVPFRAIFEKMGATVGYDASSKTISATRGSTTVKLTIGSDSASVNGAAKTLAAAPYIKDDRTMVPLRFVGEAFGATVNFDPVTTKIAIEDSNWPKRGGQLNLAIWNAPDGDFNPITVSDTYGSNLTGMMYDGLWRYDERYTPIPALAESWEWNEAGDQLTFYLRKDLKFHDGTPVTADDVVFTYKAIFHPKYKGPRNTGFEDVRGWEDYNKGVKGESADNFANGFVTTTGLEGLYAPDPYTVVFKLKQPNTVFLYSVAFGPVDHKRYENIPVQDWGTARDPNNVFPNGTGAFKMSRAEEGQYYLLVANDDYWSGRPYVDKVLYSVTSSDVAVGQVQTGKLDQVEFSANEFASYKDLEAKGLAKITEYPDMLFQMMMYNTAQGPLADKRVRQAINYAVNRNDIIHNLMQDHASTMYGPIHPLTWAYSDDINHYDFDVNKSKQLLDDAGWSTIGSDGVRMKDGKRLHVRLSYPAGNPVRVKTAPVVQQWLKDVGIEVELIQYDWPTIDKKIFEDHDFDIQFMGFQLGNSDPDPTGLWDKASTVAAGFNATGWWTDKSEKLIAEGRRTGDLEERIQIYQDFAKEWVDDSPAYIFYAVNTLTAASPRLQNYKPGPQGQLWNLEELWLSK